MKIKITGVTKQYDPSNYNGKTYYSKQCNLLVNGNVDNTAVRTMSKKVYDLLTMGSELNIELEAVEQTAKESGNKYYFIMAQDNKHLFPEQDNNNPSSGAKNGGYTSNYQSKSKSTIDKVSFATYEKFALDIAELTKVIAVTINTENTALIFDRLLSNGCVKVNMESVTKEAVKDMFQGEEQAPNDDRQPDPDQDVPF